jgi:AraC-like DNA-binding protein
MPEASSEIFFPTLPEERMLVRMIWKVQERNLDAAKEMILPKGTAEIIFNLSEKGYCRKSNSSEIIDIPTSLINGVNFSPYEIVKSGYHCFFGIQLNPYALKFLFHIPVAELNDRVISSELLCPELNILAEQVAAAGMFNRQTAILMNWLRKKITASNGCITDKRITAIHYDGEVHHYSAGALSKKYNLCDRQLRRISNEWMGMCPADYLIYRKYLKALYEIHKEKDSLTGVAYESGFYDQAHLVRTFRFFTGYTPGKYKKMMGPLPGHIYFT